MALKLFKLVIDAATETTTKIKPDIIQYFYEFDADDVDDGTLIIPATSFIDDTGDEVVTLETVTPNNGYYRLFINGVLQQYGLYTTAETSVTVTIGTETIPDGAPVTLIVANFDPESDSDTVIAT
ncbi:MAG TPA: DUF4183 domain-containing protein [Oscillospiraceae bacterium]|nr:DUF4183 domain-containing protein [Oscillospiraceae bacterium]